MQSADRDQSRTPLVSVVMANFEAGERIVHALRSVLRQTMTDFEVIVSDDASRDDSQAHVRRMMEQDDRIRLVTSERNRGPARCRNRALDVARGRWIAIVDSDDIIHPERLERLLAGAVYHKADIVADDQLLFFEDGTAPRLMLDDDVDTSFSVDAERWVLAGADGSPALGYLKPLILAERLGSLRYDDVLRIGEDYDLVLRLLLDGGRMVVMPEPLYLYRRHTGSISHRLSSADLSAMIEREAALVSASEPLTASLEAAFATRLRALRQGLAYEELVARIKARRLGEALELVARDFTHLRRLWTSFSEGKGRRGRPAATGPSPVLFLGGEGTDGASEVVPAYVSAQSIDWSAPSPRQVWRDLAGRRGVGAVQCVPLDIAGRYAAGFIPEAEILSLASMREAL